MGLKKLIKGIANAFSSDEEEKKHEYTVFLSNQVDNKVLARDALDQLREKLEDDGRSDEDIEKIIESAVKSKELESLVNGGQKIQKGARALAHTVNEVNKDAKKLNRKITRAADGEGDEMKALKREIEKLTQVMSSIAPVQSQRQS